MLHGEKVGLRARHDSDITFLHEELSDDVPVRLRADPRPWRPIPPGSVDSPYQVKEPGDDVTFFSVVELSGHYPMLSSGTAVSLRAKRCCGESTPITGSPISGCHCGQLFGVEDWVAAWLLCCANTDSRLACTDCRWKLCQIVSRCCTPQPKPDSLSKVRSGAQPG